MLEILFGDSTAGILNGDGNSDMNMFGGKKTNRKDVIASVQIWEE